MGRVVLAVIGGLVSWFATGAVLFRLLRWAWPAYAIAEPAVAFDVAMQLSRLAIGVVCSVVAGWLAARVARGQRRAAWMLGILLVMLFLPIHHGLWDKFPLWYHAAFLVTLAPIVGWSGHLCGARTDGREAGPEVVAATAAHS